MTTPRKCKIDDVSTPSFSGLLALGVTRKFLITSLSYFLENQGPTYIIHKIIAEYLNPIQIWQGRGRRRKRGIVMF